LEHHVSEQQGPGRRLGEDEEERAAQLFAKGSTDRQVADALDVGAGTANRLRHRMKARIAELAALDPAGARKGLEAAVDTLQTTLEITQASEAAWRAELLEALREQHDDLTAALTAWQARAEASREALRQLAAERAELLVAGRDAAPLRARRSDAEADLEDSEAAAALVAGRIADVDTRIAEQERALRRIAEQDAAAAAQAAREAANLEGEKLLAHLATHNGGLLKCLVQGRVSAADAASYVARLHSLAEAAGWPANWFDARLLPRQSLFADPWGAAVAELLAALVAGDLNACYPLAKLCQPWQDRDEEFTARERAELDKQRQDQHDKVVAGIALNNAKCIAARGGITPTVQPEVLDRIERDMRIKAMQNAYARQPVTADDLHRPW
jgi:transposase